MEMRPMSKSLSRTVIFLVAVLVTASMLSSLSLAWTPNYCTNHAECSQACGGSCSYNVYGCCSGDYIGQCNLNSHSCYCSYSPSYCGTTHTQYSGTSSYSYNYYTTYPYNYYYTNYYPYYYYNYYHYNYPYYYPTQTVTQPAPNYNFVISIAPSSQTVNAGQLASFTVTVTNTGSAADTYTLSTTYGTLGTTSVYLGPGGSQSLALTAIAQSSGGSTIVVTANSVSINLGKSASATLNSIPTATSTITSTIIYTTSTSTVAYQYCSQTWMGSYSCSGNYVTQAYRNADCSQTWMNTQYCQYGCSNGACAGSPYNYQYQNYYPNIYPNYPSTCQASASMTTPRDAYQGDFISTTATITNIGGSAGTVNLNAYICYADGSNCQPIYCSNSLNPSIAVPAQSVATVTCGVRTAYNYNYYNPNAPYTNPPIGYSGNYYGNYYYPGYYPSNYPGVNYNYGNYYVTNTNTLPYYSTPYNIYQNAYPYNYNYNYYGYNPSSYNLPAGAYRIRLDWNGCGISDPTMYTGPFRILPYQSLATTATTTTTTTTTTTATTPTTTTTAATGTTTTIYLWPFNFHVPGTGYLARAYAWTVSNLPSLKTMLTILLIVLVIILIILVSQWRPSRSYGAYRGGGRREEEAFRTHYGHWNFQGMIRGRMQKVFKFNGS